MRARVGFRNDGESIFNFRLKHFVKDGDPQPLPILTSSEFVPKIGFPVVKVLTRDPWKMSTMLFNIVHCIRRPWEYLLGYALILSQLGFSSGILMLSS